jgi:hypothetical protein
VAHHSAMIVDDLGLLTADRIFDDTAGLQLLP